MAAMTVNPLSQIAAVQRSTANANASANSNNPASALNAASETGSFAQELKARTQAPEAPKQAQPGAPKPAQQQSPQKPSEQANQPQQSTQDTKDTADAGSTATAEQAATTDTADTTTTPLDPTQLLQALGKDGLAKDSDEDKDTQLANDAAPQLIATPFLPATAAPAANAAAAGKSGDSSLPNLTTPAQSLGAQSEPKDLLQLAENATDTPAIALKATESGEKTTGLSSENTLPATTSFAAELEQARQNVASTVNQSAQPSPVATAQHVVHTPVGIPGWADEVGQRVTWAAQNDNGRAELVLTPAHLGRVEVSISVNGDQATANFVAASSAAREALEDSLPRLREVLNQAGIQLGQANVSTGQGHQAQSDSRANHGAFASSQARSNGMNDLPLPNTHSAILRSGNGLVDTFA